MVERRPYLTLVIFVAVVVVAAGASAGFLYYETHPKRHTVTVAEIGDNVTVNYIGSFANTSQAGRVFDTSIYAVALNDLRYPKALEYAPRGAPANYTPLGVALGPNIPSGGYTLGNLTFGSVVPGFWQGVVGMAPNTTRTFTFPDSLGYGPLNASCLVQEPLVTTLPVISTISRTTFSTEYNDSDPVSGALITDPLYGWPVFLLNVNQSAVTLENLPSVGTVTDPYGWDEVVTAISTSPYPGTLTLQSQLSPTQAGLVLGHLPSGQTFCGVSSFIIWGVNPAAGTFTENFNEEIYGASLAFTVTLVDLFLPTA